MELAQQGDQSQLEGEYENEINQNDKACGITIINLLRVLAVTKERESGWSFFS